MEIQKIKTEVRIENKENLLNTIYLVSLFSLTLVFMATTLLLLFVIIAALNAKPNELWNEIPMSLNFYFRVFLGLSFSFLGTIVTFIVFIRKFLSVIK